MFFLLWKPFSHKLIKGSMGSSECGCRQGEIGEKGSFNLFFRDGVKRIKG
jgi:hypothetical protein